MKHEINDEVYSQFVSKLVSNNFDIENAELRQVIHLLADAISLSERADKLKRVIFYVKTQHNETSLNPVEMDAVHGMLGHISEIGELILGVFDIQFPNTPIKDVNLPLLALKPQSERGNVNEECGDLTFYLSMILSCFGLNLNDAKRTNMKKLAARYSNLEFTPEEALELRNIANELQIINASTEQK